MAIQKVGDVDEGELDQVKLLACGALDSLSLLVTQFVQLRRTTVKTVTPESIFNTQWIAVGK